MAAGSKRLTPLPSLFEDEGSLLALSWPETSWASPFPCGSAARAVRCRREGVRPRPREPLWGTQAAAALRQRRGWLLILASWQEIRVTPGAEQPPRSCREDIARSQATDGLSRREAATLFLYGGVPDHLSDDPSKQLHQVSGIPQQLR